jgi:hypothetical protein
VPKSRVKGGAGCRRAELRAAPGAGLIGGSAGCWAQLGEALELGAVMGIGRRNRRRRPGDDAVKQEVLGTTRGWRGEGSGVVTGDGGAPVNFSSLTASSAKAFGF